mgnify:CR=1 FL=1
MQLNIYLGHNLVSLVFTWSHWYHLVSLVSLGLTGFTWIHLVSLGVIWFHLVSSGLAWFHSASLHFIWFHLISLGFTWSHQLSRDGNWCCLTSSGLTWSHLHQQDERAPGSSGIGAGKRRPGGAAPAANTASRLEKMRPTVADSWGTQRSKFFVFLLFGETVFCEQNCCYYSDHDIISLYVEKKVGCTKSCKNY